MYRLHDSKLRQSIGLSILAVVVAACGSIGATVSSPQDLDSRGQSVLEELKREGRETQWARDEQVIKDLEANEKRSEDEVRQIQVDQGIEDDLMDAAEGAGY